MLWIIWSQGSICYIVFLRFNNAKIKTNTTSNEYGKANTQTSQFKMANLHKLLRNLPVPLIGQMALPV